MPRERGGRAAAPGVVFVEAGDGTVTARDAATGLAGEGDTRATALARLAAALDRRTGDGDGGGGGADGGHDGGREGGGDGSRPARALAAALGGDNRGSGGAGPTPRGAGAVCRWLDEHAGPREE